MLHLIHTTLCCDIPLDHGGYLFGFFGCGVDVKWMRDFIGIVSIIMEYSLYSEYKRIFNKCGSHPKS